MNLSTTGLILLSLTSTFLHHLMKRKVIGLALLTTKVTLSPGGSSLRILKRSSFILVSEVPSELQQTSVLHHLQGRGPHFLFPFLILNTSNSLPLDPLDASTPNFEQFVKSQSGEDEDHPIPMANIDIPNLLGRSFLLPPEDNGERHMAKIIDIDDHEQPLEDIKFKLKINKDQTEEIMSYNQLMDTSKRGQMLKKIQTHSSSLGTSLHTKAHLNQLTQTTKGANTMSWLNGSLGRSLMNL